MLQLRAVDAVMELASGQWGIVTTAQAEQQGVPRLRLSRMVGSGLLERIGHGVYAVPTSVGDQWTELRAAWISLDPRRTAEQRIAESRTSVVVSHESAARLHRFGTLRGSSFEFTATKRRQTRRDDVRVHVGSLVDDDVTLVDGLPTTTATRTIADLLRNRYDLGHVAEVAADALRQGLTTASELELHLGPLARRYSAADGPQLVEQLLETDSTQPEGSVSAANHNLRDEPT